MKAEITDSSAEPVAAPERSGGARRAAHDDGLSAPAREAAPAKRRPGKPKGLPKSGGRQRGTPNRSTVQTRDRILELADPIAFLADVMAGTRMVAAGEPGDMKKTWCYPTLAQRVQASETLLRKLLPDLKATELSGPDGAPLVEPTRRDELYSSMELARRTAFMLRAGDDAKRELAVLDAPGPQLIPETVTVTDAPEPPIEPTEPQRYPKRPDRTERGPERF